MILDAQIAPYTTLKDIPGIARAAEEFGFGCLWAAETQHNPFLPGALVIEHTQKLQFGTAIAVSFGRSPSVMAHAAWDLAEYSRGRFILGLGTQVRAHITRRFGMPWPDSVSGKLREQIEVMRAFWQHWQTGEKLDYAGDHYHINLSSPFFTPARHDYPDIPVFIAGVNAALARLAGETCQGFHTHPFHSPKYLRELILPQIEKGAARNGRTREDVQVVAHAFVVTNPTEWELVRQQIAFYASTPSYRPVLAAHGWEEIGDRLRELSRAGKWMEMPDLISDEMVEAYAATSAPEDLAATLKERYRGIADRVNLYLPFLPGERDEFWQTLCQEMNG